MNFSAWAIRNPVPVILVFVMLTVTGLMGFNRLDVQTMPDMDLPMIRVSATLDGAAASQLETEVARKIEDQLAGIAQLEGITTTIVDGAVTINVEFDVAKDAQVALDEVKSAVDQVRGELPAGMNAPVVTKSDLASSPLVTYVLKSDRLDEAELSWFIDNDLTKRLMTVEGVGQVARLGGVDREIRVQLNPGLLESLGVTAAVINQQLDAVQRDYSGGKGRIGDAAQSVRVLAAASSVEELRSLPIPLPNGGWVRLDEIGTVEDTHADRSSLAYLNGEPVVAVQIKRSKGHSDLTVIEGIREELDTFMASHPEVSFSEAYNTSIPIAENYESSMMMLYEGAALAIVVVFLFLRDWRATFIAATALPLSIIPAFLVMDLLGYSLNAVTLLALSLVVGILVDDAIVEVENIDRHLTTGKNPYDAAMEAASEIGLAVVATTLSLVAVFLPTAFMGGIPGIIFKQFGVTASVAVLFSLLVARMVTPLLAAYMMKPGQHVEQKDGPVMAAYLWLVRACLRRRWIPVLGVVAFVGGSFVLLGQMSTAFFPAQDVSISTITVTAPPGSTIEQTNASARKAAEAVRGVAHVKDVFMSTGVASSGSPQSAGTDSVTSASIIVVLDRIADRDVTQQQIETELRAALAGVPGVRIEVGASSMGATLAVSLGGEDAATLEEAASRLEAEIRTIPGIGNVTSSAGLQTPEITITPNLAEAASLGVTTSAISEAIRVATAGAFDTALNHLNLPERQVPIRVMLHEESRQSIDRIAMIQVPGTNGNVSLGAVADISIGSAPSQISRFDRTRNVKLTIELNGQPLSAVQAQVEKLEAYRMLPAGVHHVEQGDLKRQNEMFLSFVIAMATGIFCVYAVLVLLFHDFVQPVTILMALPLALGGALGPLILLDQSFSMPALIGLLLLMGIVTKNSILLVEYAIVSIRDGMSRFDALIDACRKRARPIVMTSIAMGCGMLPAALSFVEGDPSFRQPMGIVVIGGLITSTLLSLVVIPVVFTFMDDLEHGIGRLLSWRRKKTQVADTADVADEPNAVASRKVAETVEA